MKPQTQPLLPLLTHSEKLSQQMVPQGWVEGPLLRDCPLQNSPLLSVGLDGPPEHISPLILSGSPSSCRPHPQSAGLPWVSTGKEGGKRGHLVWGLRAAGPLGVFIC